MTEVTRKRLTVIQEWVILPNCLLKSSSVCHPLDNILMGHTYLHAFAHPESYIHILLPPISLSSVFESCSFQSLTIQPNHWPQSMNWYIIMHVAISPFKQSAEPGTLLEVLAIGRISLHRCLSGMIQKGAVVLLLSTFEWCLHIIAELSGNQTYVMSSSFS